MSLFALAWPVERTDFSEYLVFWRLERAKNWLVELESTVVGHGHNF